MPWLRCSDVLICCRRSATGPPPDVSAGKIRLLLPRQHIVHGRMGPVCLWMSAQHKPIIIQKLTKTPSRSSQYVPLRCGWKSALNDAIVNAMKTKTEM
jgi:hypothetical protein